MACANAGSGTQSSVRSDRAANGKVSEVNSSSTHSTLLPGGSDPATSPTRAETCAPTATQLSGTWTRPANVRRLPATAAS
jgi:hypothetical protein